MDPPASSHGRPRSGPLAYDNAQKNYFWGLVNEPRGDNPYRTNENNNGEAWLYDRSAAMFVLYMHQVILGSSGLYDTFIGGLFQSPSDWIMKPYRRYAWTFRTSAAYSFALGDR